MGTKYPKGESPVWPPRDWICPSCKHHHDKAHFPHPGQVDYKKSPGTLGRVKFNRADDDDGIKGDTTYKKEYEGKPGEMIVDNVTQGLFCPHCGWQEEVIDILKTKDKPQKGWLSIDKIDCSIRGCKKKATHTNISLHFCDEHYKVVTT